jgi:hypothetical protein
LGVIERTDDAVVVNHPGNLLVIEAAQHAMSGGHAESAQLFRPLRIVEMAEHRVPLAIVGRDDRVDESRQGGMAIRRNLADAQHSLRVSQMGQQWCSGRDRFAEPAHGHECHAAIDQRAGEVRPQCKGTIEQRDRPCKMSGLVGNDALAVCGIDVAWFHR